MKRKVTRWCSVGKYGMHMHRTCQLHGYGQGVLCLCECHMTDKPRKIDADTWAFPLPITKPLSMNDREHWSGKAKRVEELRSATRWMVKATRIPKCQKVRVTLVYEPRDARRRDPLNLVATLKPVQDAIVDEKVVPDDTAQYMDSPMPLIDEPIGGRHGKLWVLVERIA